MIVKSSVSKRSLQFATTLLVSAVLAACGGGGGGSSDPIAGTPTPAPSPSPSPSPSPAPSTNQAPVASLAYTPGAPNVLRVGTAVALSATSTDPESQSMTHSWELVSRPAGSSAALDNTTGAAVNFTPDRVGSYQVRVTSSDGTASNSALSTLEVVNRAPSASLSAPTTGTAGTAINLSATSTDADSGQTLSHVWSFVSQPTGATAASFTTPTAASTSFTPTAAGTYVVRVTTSDGIESAASANFSITVAAAASPAPTPPSPPPPPPPAANVAPVASLTRAGSSPSGVGFINTAESFTATSTDANGQTLTHTWTLTRPAGSAVATSGTGNTFAFTPDVQGTYTLSLSSSDGALSNSTSTSLLVTNRVPVAALTRTAPAGTATINIGTVVTYTANSTDADNQTLTHAWTLTTRPVGSTVAASGSGTSFTFTPDLPGDYAISLASNDGIGNSTNSATGAFTVVNRPPTSAIAIASSTPSTVRIGDEVSLTASGTDPDGHAVTYGWTLTQPTSGVALSAASGTATTFRPTAAGNYVVTLRATDSLGLQNAADATQTIVVAAQPAEVACGTGVTTGSLFRFRGPLAVSPATSATVSVGGVGASANGTENQGNQVCFHQSVLRDIVGHDTISQGGYYYFEATRSGPAHIGVTGLTAAVAQTGNGNVTWPANTNLDTYVLSPCSSTAPNAAGCLMSGYDASSTNTVGFAVDYTGAYPVVSVIGVPTARGDIPDGCKIDTAVSGTVPSNLRSSCVIQRQALNVSGALRIYAYGQTAGGVQGSVTINGGQSSYAFATNSVRDSLRRHWYEGGRAFNSPYWPSVEAPASNPVVPTITRAAVTRYGGTGTTSNTANTVIRIGDLTPFRRELAVTATGVGVSVSWRNASGTSLGTGTTLTLPLPATAGALPSGWAAGDNRIEAVATIGSGTNAMTATVGFNVRYAPAATTPTDTTDEDWDGDGLTYAQETSLARDPASTSTYETGIGDGESASALSGSSVTMVQINGTTSPGAVLRDDGLAIALTSQVNPRCLVQAAAGAYAGLNSETCRKRGVIASSGIPQGSFRYFEVRKHAANPTATQGPNMGAGVITSGAVNPGVGAIQWGLDPFGYAGGAIDAQTPYSASFNFAADIYLRLSGRGSTFSALRGAESPVVGVLVDYRGSVPVLYFVHNELLVGSPTAGTTRIVGPVTVTGFTGDAYPTIFGHPQGDTSIAQEINFGLKPFYFDTDTGTGPSLTTRNLRAAMTAAGISLTNFELGVGRTTRTLKP